MQVKESNGVASDIPAEDVQDLEDKLGPLKNSRPTLASIGTHPDIPTLAHRSSSIGRTPPITPPGRCTSPGSPHWSSSPHSGGSPRVSRIAAPATAVDDVMQKWGRPRAHSLSRREREKVSLPVWEEEGDECGVIPPPSFEDRRRSVSMSEALPGSRSDRYRALSAPDSFNLARHQGNRELPTSVNGMGDRCHSNGCSVAPTNGFAHQGRQRRVSPKEAGMVHALRSTSLHEQLKDEDATPPTAKSSVSTTRGSHG